MKHPSKHTFPIYRKYPGGLSYFKIINDRNFVELKIMGQQLTLHHIEAKIFPDFQYITDMINLYNNHWMESSKQEYNTILQSHGHSNLID